MISWGGFYIRIDGIEPLSVTASNYTIRILGSEFKTLGGVTFRTESGIF